MRVDTELKNSLANSNMPMRLVKKLLAERFEEALPYRWITPDYPVEVSFFFSSKSAQTRSAELISNTEVEKLYDKSLLDDLA